MLKWLFGGKSEGGEQQVAAPQMGAANAGSETMPKVLDLSPETITAAVLEQMSTTPDERLKEIMAAAVTHVHQFARDVKLTPAEWLMGIEFMTKVGKMCTPDRQEFILLSDTIGLSALVNMMHDKTAIESATDTSLLGPFFREGAPRLKPGDQIAKDTSDGEVVMFGRVLDAAGKPIPNAEVCLWQTASDGLYDIQSAPGGEMDSRGIFTTDAEGRYLIRTVAARDYSIPMDGPAGALVKAQKRHGMRPAHFHFLISAPGYRELVTALYLSTSKYLDSDVVFGSASKDLVAWLKQNDPECPMQGLASIKYDFRLARESEADKKSGRVGADPAQILKN